MADPNKGNSSCVASLCNSILAYVDCTLVVLQGANGCIDIQFLNSDQTALDLGNVSNLEILLFNEFECTVGRYFYPSIPSGCTGEIIEILQETNSAGEIINEGLVRICLSSSDTQISPGTIYAEIMITLTTEETGGSSIIGIPAIEVAEILKSRIYNSQCGGNFVTGVE